MKPDRAHIKISLSILAACSLLLLMNLPLLADDLKESEHAKKLFVKSLEYLIGKRTYPTYQGRRNVVISSTDGMMRKFVIFDGYSEKFNGYHARIENNLAPPPPGGRGPGPGGKGPGNKGPGGPPGGGPPPGGRPPGGGPPSGGGPNQPMQPGQGPGGRGPGFGGQPGDDDEIFRRLADFYRPDMSPVFDGQKLIAKRLEKNNQHLIFKGPLNDKIAGRKAWVIEISPRYYSGSSMRLWLDEETLIPLKKQRIGIKGNLEYSSEYTEFKLVADKDFTFKDEPDKPNHGQLMNPGGDMQRPVPPEFMNREMVIKQQVIITKGADGFKLASMRKLPFGKLPGVHYVFSDGLNTISIFHFYNPAVKPQKNIDEFVKQLSEKLEKSLNNPVLSRIIKRNIFIVTADMSPDDLKKIAKNIALQDIEKNSENRQKPMK